MPLRMINENRPIGSATWNKTYKANTEESLKKYRERKANIADGQEWREHLCTHDDSQGGPCLVNHIQKVDGKLITIRDTLEQSFESLRDDLDDMSDAEFKALKQARANAIDKRIEKL